MQSRSGNPLATLMLSLPLMAIPLMAVFGVPQFVPVVASSISEADHLPSKPQRIARVGESASPQFALLNQSVDSQAARAGESLDDLFRPREPQRSRQPLTRTTLADAAAGPTSQASLQSASTSDPTSADSRLADLFGSTTSEIATLRSLRQEPVGTTNRTRDLSQPTRTTDDGLTWRQAVRQLNQLGIHEFRLEPGHEPGEFYFACDFDPTGDLRVTRRFEAEASEPLQAVEIVLKQINDWSGQR